MAGPDASRERRPRRDSARGRAVGPSRRSAVGQAVVPSQPAARASARTVRQRREKTENNLEKLLAAAARLMARQGYDQTTIRDVASAAGLSLSGMYYYFRGKEELLYKIQDQTFGTLLHEQEDLAALEIDAPEKLRLMVRNHLSYLTTHANELKVCTFELESLQGEYYRSIEKLRKRYFKLVAGLVADLTGQPVHGDATNGEVRHHTLFLFGMLNWAFMWFDPRRDRPIEDLGNRMVDLVLHGLPAASPR